MDEQYKPKPRKLPITLGQLKGLIARKLKETGCLDEPSYWASNAWVSVYDDLRGHIAKSGTTYGGKPDNMSKEDYSKAYQFLVGKDSNYWYTHGRDAKYKDERIKDGGYDDDDRTDDCYSIY